MEHALVNPSRTPIRIPRNSMTYTREYEKMHHCTLNAATVCRESPLAKAKRYTHANIRETGRSRPISDLKIAVSEQRRHTRVKKIIVTKKRPIKTRPVQQKFFTFSLK